MSMASFPHYQRPCGWPENAALQAIHPSLVGAQQFDWVVVGAGYTGISIARRLARQCPGDRIALLEAEQVASGSPGRNSGFVLDTVLKAPSDTAAAALHPHYQAALQELRMLAEGTVFSYLPEYIFKAAATDRGEQALTQMQHFLQRSGQSSRWLSREQLQGITGSGYYRAGLQLSGNALVNPAQLVQKLAAGLPDNVTLFEHSPAISLQRSGAGWQVQTLLGQVTAPRVMLANNAFIKGLGVGRSRSVTIYTYAGITGKLSAGERQQVMSQGQWGLLPAHRLGSTFRTTQDGRLLVRGLYGYEQEGGERIACVLQASLHQRFPDLDSAQQLEQWWGGTTSLTANGAPVWGQVSNGLFVSAGCNGVGIVKGWFLGRALADLACGKPAADIPALLGRAGWMPPEPLRRLGFLAVSGVEKHLAGAEI